MPTIDERFYQEQRRRADKKRRDQSQRQATIDARYRARAEQVVARDIERMLAGIGADEDGDDGQAEAVYR